jgi:hypothetical protein
MRRSDALLDGLLVEHARTRKPWSEKGERRRVAEGSTVVAATQLIGIIVGSRFLLKAVERLHRD